MVSSTSVTRFLFFLFVNCLIEGRLVNIWQKTQKISTFFKKQVQFDRLFSLFGNLLPHTLVCFLVLWALCLCARVFLHMWDRSGEVQVMWPSLKILFAITQIQVRMDDTFTILVRSFFHMYGSHFTLQCRDCRLYYSFKI